MKVTFDFLYVFNHRRQAVTAAERLSSLGLEARVTPGDGEGRLWQTRATRAEDVADATADDELEAHLDRLVTEYDSAISDLQPTDDSGSGFGHDVEPGRRL